MHSNFKLHKCIFFIPVFQLRILYDLLPIIKQYDKESKVKLLRTLGFAFILPLLPILLLCAAISNCTHIAVGIFLAVYLFFTLLSLSLVFFQLPNKRRLSHPTAVYFAFYIPIFAVLIAFFIFSRSSAAHYRDMNGQFDTSLSIITTDNICDESYWAWSAMGEKRQSEVISPSGAENTELDRDYIEISSYRASGICPIMYTHIKESEAWLFTAYMRVNGGNARLYVLSSENEIMYEFAIDEDDGFILDGLPEGDYALVLACESADFELMVGRKKS